MNISCFGGCQETRLAVRQYDIVLDRCGRLRTDMTIPYRMGSNLGGTVSTLGDTQVIGSWVDVVLLARAMHTVGLDIG